MQKWKRYPADCRAQYAKVEMAYRRLQDAISESESAIPLSAGHHHKYLQQRPAEGDGWHKPDSYISDG